MSTDGKDPAAAQLQDEGEMLGTAHVGDLEAKADAILKGAEAAIEQFDTPEQAKQGRTKKAPQPFRLEDLVGNEGPPDKCSIDLIRDVDLDLRVELGRTEMLLEDVLKLRRGSVVTLDKLAGDPVDLFVNGRLVAKGEILVLNDNFCVRVAQLIGSDSLD
ncbi:MAG: flagellar motor switch protein FliN [Planctomycetales bacterium]|nr:flagellar motor switch protein FliN [Planctomycetales bacterium]